VASFTPRPLVLVMIISVLIEFYNVKVFDVVYFFNPFVFFERGVVINSFLIFCYYFSFLFSIS
jgi:hypothetical protein